VHESQDILAEEIAKKTHENSSGSPKDMAIVSTMTELIIDYYLYFMHMK
jgi:hypothetical protein